MNLITCRLPRKSNTVRADDLNHDSGGDLGVATADAEFDALPVIQLDELSIDEFRATTARYCSLVLLKHAYGLGCLYPLGALL